MFVVYWLDGDPETEANARHQKFDPAALAEALRFAEELRKRQAQGDAIGFVTLCSENPQSVGKPGVADPPADYDWKKRRR
ncbi:MULTISPECIES: hypothetical protein [unclassified Caballeronia]|uniref:hypothetical protein n=1 Tax=unclassified Caballeronia TaxID=2646786 RepID=UPI002858CE26|nr:MULTISPECIES: hypothetical protein [unclassified Caballeronia]MDR5740860.1 hypothetical protein [Caballeronia sp. LZ016]MDR5808619.1 hypothetical protein [Caballeronia sp. LZ019]